MLGRDATKAPVLSRPDIPQSLAALRLHILNRLVARVGLEPTTSAL